MSRYSPAAAYMGMVGRESEAVQAGEEEAVGNMWGESGMWCMEKQVRKRKKQYLTERGRSVSIDMDIKKEKLPKDFPLGALSLSIEVSSRFELL